MTIKSLMTCTLLLALFSLTLSAQAQNDILPPALGQETKGQPAAGFDENVTAQSDEAVDGERDEQSSEESANDSPFGRTTITELRRDSGQLYMIELESSFGSKQYIEETDSDGKIESTSNDIEETPNLPKWKLGSW